jgi:ECF transporter S component (folate family)
VAISIVCGKYLAINAGPFLRFSFENLPVILSGIMFGPVIGAIVGGTADLIGALIVYGGDMNIFITLGAMSIGLTSGLIWKFLPKLPNAVKLLLATFIAHLIGSVIIKSLGLAAYYFAEYNPKRKNPELLQYRGISWAGPKNRWCTAMLKTRITKAYLREMRKQYEVIEYVGIAADESRRVRERCYPLVEWGMTEADCLAYCYERGFYWGGLYELFSRVSCWCCPLQSLNELRKLYEHFPNLWCQLQKWDDMTWRQFRADFSVRELTIRFEMEKEWMQNGQSIKSKAFHKACICRNGINYLYILSKAIFFSNKLSYKIKRSCCTVTTNNNLVRCYCSVFNVTFMESNKLS